MIKYIADLSKPLSNGGFNLVEIESFSGENTEEKIKLAQFLSNKNKSIRLFDCEKKLIGDIELTGAQAREFYEAKEKELAKRESEIEEKIKQLEGKNKKNQQNKEV